jgi:hypothetical protein
MVLTREAGYMLCKDWSLPLPPPPVEDEGFLLQPETQTAKYYTSYVYGIKTYLKSVGQLRNKHKIIETEMDRHDSRRVVVKRATLKFKKEHLQGYTLIESEVD